MFCHTVSPEVVEEFMTHIIGDALPETLTPEQLERPANGFIHMPLNRVLERAGGLPSTGEARGEVSNQTEQQGD